MRALKSVLFVLVLSACSSDNYLASSGHASMDRGDFQAAAEAFKKDADKPGTNQLLFMLDQGSAHFSAGQYKEAIAVFLKAEKLAEIKDYTSISEEVGTLATSDNIRGYKGEDFEKVLINVYLALSFAAIGDVEGAQVESRKINQLLYKMIHDGKRNYEESPFARYLSGVLWEASGDVNAAYVDYKFTHQLDAFFPGLGSDLLSTSKRMGFQDEFLEWKKKYKEEVPRQLAPDEGELVVVFEQGQSPIKEPRDGRNSSLPTYISRSTNDAGAQVVVNSKTVELQTGLDIDTLSKRYLDDRINRMTAAKLAGVVTKGALAVGVAKLSKSEDLGWLAFYLLMFSDRADLRSWRSLPGQLKFARVPLKEGLHHVRLDVLGYSGLPIRSKNYERLEIRRGKKVFLMAR